MTDSKPLQITITLRQLRMLLEIMECHKVKCITDFEEDELQEYLENIEEIYCEIY